MVIPSSLCASSGLSHTFFGNTLESQSVLTKVVRPVPDAPVFEKCVKDIVLLNAYIYQITCLQPSR
jgi:hypothetical protein